DIKRAPCSPRLTTTVRGPIAAIARAARIRLGSLASWRASASLIVTTSTSVRTRRSASCLPWIQKFIVSSATRRGRSCIWRRTSWTLPKGVSTLSSATEPTTRRSATPASRRGEVAVEQEREPRPGLRRECLGARDHRVLEEVPARARAGRRERRDHGAEDFPRRRDVLQEVLDHGLDGDRRVRLVPHVVIGRERQRRVA